MSLYIDNKLNINYINRMNIRSNEKIKKILDSTMELIAENGLHNTPMSKVSKHSGVSVGVIYHYFPSKEALINHLYLNIKKEISEAIFIQYERKAPYRERFVQIWKNYFNYIISKPKKLSFIEQCSTSPLISDEAKEEGYKYLVPLMNFINEGIESEHLKNINIYLILYLINGAIVNTAKLHLSDKLKINEEYKDTAILYCWNGLKN